MLHQRNKLLKQMIYEPSLIDTLDIWDEQLVNYGIRIIKTRTKFLQMLSEIVTKYNSRLTGGKERVEVFMSRMYHGKILQTSLSRQEKGFAFL